MAAKSVDHLSKFEQQLTCPVCLELFKNPKTLPCLHTFCQDCLRNCPQEFKGRKYVLKCPSCRKPAIVPNGGVSVFPPAFTINNFLELHQQMLAKQDTMECDQHKRPLDLFCNTCQELLCYVCQVRSHKKHDYHLISDIIHDCKQEVKKGAHPLREQLAVIADTVKGLGACDEEVSQLGEAAKQQFRSPAQEARAAIDQAETELIESVCISVHVAVKKLKRPVGVALSRSGNVIVSEYGGNCISVFSNDFKLLKSFGSPGQSDNRFLDPFGLAVTKDDCILVADSGNARIQVLTADGQFMKPINSCGSSPLRFDHPTGIAVHPNGQILVSDTFSSRIQVFNSNFTFSHSFGSYGSQPKEFDGPCGVAVDSQGIVYIADRYNSRIQKFTISGKYKEHFVLKEAKKGQPWRPEDIAIDAKGLIYVSDPSSDRICIFTSDGKLLKCLGEGDQEHPILQAPCGLALDESGNLYVCNSESGELVVF